MVGHAHSLKHAHSNKRHAHPTVCHAHSDTRQAPASSHAHSNKTHADAENHTDSDITHARSAFSHAPAVSERLKRASLSPVDVCGSAVAVATPSMVFKGC